MNLFSTYKITRIPKPFTERNYRLSLGQNWIHDLSRHLDFDKIKIIGDIGANIGQSSNHFASIFTNAKIFAFEPDPKTFKDLVKNTAANDRIYGFNFGAGEQEETLNFYRHDNSELSSFVEAGAVISSGEEPEPKIIDASVITLDQFDAFNEGIDFLKIDNQGFDLEVLRGADNLITQGKIKSILIEVSFGEWYKSSFNYPKLLEYLHQRNFIMIGIYNLDYSKGRRMISWGDCLFLHESAKKQPCPEQ